MKFDQLAQEMVEATSRLVHMRTINIMNTDGIIIASTDLSRIGDFHKGAQEVIRTGQPVYIRKDNLGLYPGSREGCNMPIFGLENRIVGVVGIYGNPDAVEDAAHLLAIYTTQYFAQNAATQQQFLESELRGKLLRMLLSLKDSDHENVIDLCQALHIQFRLPARVLVVKLGMDTKSFHELHLFSPVVNELLSCGLLQAQSDVWAMEDSRLIIIKSKTGNSDSAFLHQLHSAIADRFERTVFLSAGSGCHKLNMVKTSYSEALALDQIGEMPISDITDPHCRFNYFLYSSCNQNKGYIQELYGKLLKALGEKETQVMLTTAMCYYAQNGSVTKAANLLHIHKNTLQYRMHKLWDALEIGDCTAFEREYFLRLCIRYHTQFSGAS